MKKLVNLEMQNLQPRRPALAGILLIRIDLLGYLPASPCAEHERTPSPNASGCAFARVFTKCAARSKFQLRIIAKKSAKPAVLGHRRCVRCTARTVARCILFSGETGSATKCARYRLVDNAQTGRVSSSRCKRRARALDPLHCSNPFGWSNPRLHARWMGTNSYGGRSSCHPNTTLISNLLLRTLPPASPRRKIRSSKHPELPNRASLPFLRTRESRLARERP